MSNKTFKKPLVAAIGAAVVGTLAAGTAIAADNPFGLKQLDSGYMQTAMEGKCGEGKCGSKMKKEAEGKCGEGKCGSKMKKEAEGKCGEGKCGGKPKAKEGKCGEGKCGGSK
ncbi:MAG: low-complexity protein [Chromatiales bacterium]|jgi:uncharacterized low-complexity protein